VSRLVGSEMCIRDRRNPSREHLEMPRDRETFFFSRGAHLLCSLLERTYLDGLSTGGASSVSPN
jgi:hypothetical protein